MSIVISRQEVATMGKARGTECVKVPRASAVKLVALSASAHLAFVSIAGVTRCDDARSGNHARLAHHRIPLAAYRRAGSGFRSAFHHTTSSTRRTVRSDPLPSGSATGSLSRCGTICPRSTGSIWVWGSWQRAIERGARARQSHDAAPGQDYRV
jgi:hypothetical protein